MWIVYQKKDRQVVGFSALGDQDPDKQVAIAEIVKGLVSGGAPDKYDAVQVTDRDQAQTLMTAPLQYVVIGESGKGKLHASFEPPKVFRLQIQSDAPDVHPVDGIPEIKADGSSFTTITVQKVDGQGEAQKARGDNDDLHLRTTAGTLQSADGKEGISSVKLKQGQAAFRLVSEKARRVATINVFNGDANVEDTSIRIEFI